MNPSFTKTTLVVALLIFLVSKSNGQTFNFPVLIERIQNNSWNENVGDTINMNKWIIVQNFNGSWSEFNYGVVPISGSNKHLARLLELAKACTNPKHPKYNNELYKKAIRSGLHFWYNSKTNDSNWWWNQIGWPKNLGLTMILMRKFPGYLSDGQFGINEDEILSDFKPSQIEELNSRGLGANMLDFSLHYIYRAILTEDTELLKETSAFLELNLVNNLQTDFSFQEHGPQLQISSYGSKYSKAVINIAYYLAATPAEFDVKAGHFSSFLKFVREVQLPAIRGNNWDFSIAGRGVSRPNETQESYIELKHLRDLIDPKNADIYDAALKRMSKSQPSSFKPVVLSTHFWTSDYTIHSKPNYLFSIRNVSTRSVEGEKGNGENLKANFLSYGANFIAVDGNEYNNIMPVWDWSMLPGVTSRQTANFPSRPSWGVNFGKTDFVGGVSFNNYGAICLEMDHDKTTAKKAWFLFEDEIVCLGNSINSKWPNVNTTLDQCYGKDFVFFSENGSNILTSKELMNPNSSNISWIQHHKIAYFFPEKQKVNYSLEKQSGTWFSINNNQSNDTIINKVFKLWIEHGNQPEEAKYAYIIVPNILDGNAAKNYPIESIEIVQNEADIQAVFHKKLNIYQIIFYNPGTFKHQNLSFKVDIPCVIQIEQNSIISIADPSQKLDIANIQFLLKGNSTTESVILPIGEYRGSTKTFIIDPKD